MMLGHERGISPRPIQTRGRGRPTLQPTHSRAHPFGQSMPKDAFMEMALYLNIASLANVAHVDMLCATLCREFWHQRIQIRRTIERRCDVDQLGIRTRDANVSCSPLKSCRSLKQLTTLPEQSLETLELSLAPLAFHVALGRFYHHAIFTLHGTMEDQWISLLKADWPVAIRQLKCALLVEFIPTHCVREACAMFEEATIFFQCQSLYMNRTDTSGMEFHGIVVEFLEQQKHTWLSFQVAEFIAAYTNGWNTSDIARLISLYLAQLQCSKAYTGELLTVLQSHADFAWMENERIFFLLSFFPDTSQIQFCLEGMQQQLGSSGDKSQMAYSLMHGFKFFPKVFPLVFASGLIQNAKDIEDLLQLFLERSEFEHLVTVYKEIMQVWKQVDVQGRSHDDAATMESSLDNLIHLHLKCSSNVFACEQIQLNYF